MSTTDRALAAVSAEAVQVSPGIHRLGTVAAHGDSMVRALVAAVLCSFGALQLHLEHTLTDPINWPVPGPVRGARARQSRPGTNRGAKGQKPQAKPRGRA